MSEPKPQDDWWEDHYTRIEAAAMELKTGGWNITGERVSEIFWKHGIALANKEQVTGTK